jgi:hypothetical protein
LGGGWQSPLKRRAVGAVEAAERIFRLHTHEKSALFIGINAQMAAERYRLPSHEFPFSLLPTPKIGDISSPLEVKELNNSKLVTISFEKFGY